MSELEKRQTMEGLERDTAATIREMQRRGMVGTGESFASIISGEVDIKTGRRVVEKAELIGKPFAITAVSFNLSPQNPGHDFVSCEATTMDDEQVVINDGSTGIRRQVVDYLQTRGLIQTGPAREVVLEKNGKNVKEKFDNPLDIPSYRWPEAGIVEGGRDYRYDLAPRPLVVVSGLRVSEYQNEYGHGQTYYFA